MFCNRKPKINDEKQDIETISKRGRFSLSIINRRRFDIVSVRPFLSHCETYVETIIARWVSRRFDDNNVSTSFRHRFSLSQAPVTWPRRRLSGLGRLGALSCAVPSSVLRRS